jgi:serine/threonine protein kinase
MTLSVDDLAFEDLFASRMSGALSTGDHSDDTNHNSVPSSTTLLHPPAPATQPLSTSPARVQSPSAAASTSPVQHVDIRERAEKEDFEFRRLIGRGAFGRVYLAVKRNTQRVYAIKAFRKDFLIERDAVDSTRFERDALLRVEHPFIVKLQYAFQTAGRLYLVMEFVRGGQLLTHMRKETLFEENNVRFYAAELFLALEKLHGMQIVHRDIKPENVLVDEHGHLRLTDFGFARMLRDGERSESLCGTYEYMAPEMLTGNSHGFECDWWSFGVLLHEMLIGTPPYRSGDGVTDDAESMLKLIRRRKLKLPSFFRAVTSKIIYALLQQDPAKRLTCEQVRAHGYFRNVDFDAIYQRKVQPPFRPAGDVTDLRHFDHSLVSQPIVESPAPTPDKPDIFAGFSYTAPTHITDTAPRVTQGFETGGSSSHKGRSSLGAHSCKGNNDNNDDYRDDDIFNGDGDFSGEELQF